MPRPHSVTGGFPWSLLQAEQPQLLPPVFTGEVLQPSHVYGSPPDFQSKFTSFFYWGPQSWRQRSRWGLTRAEWRGRITSLDLLAMLHLMQWLRLDCKCMCPTFHPPGSPGLSLQGCSQSACTDTGGCPDPGIGPCAWSCWTS